MKTIIQRFDRTNSGGCEVWVDTSFRSIKVARREFPTCMYREIHVIA
jgi:hypothetical protein